jgi:glucose-1-phosphate thymidylyltransferase
VKSAARPALRSEVVKGLILAGGSGSRLRPITHTSAKQLVPVANKPIIFYGLEHMVAAGVREFGIVVGVGDAAEEIRAEVGDGSRWGVDITYIPQDAPLGLGHCVLISREFLGDDDFIMYLGDNMIQQGVAAFVERFETDRARSNTPTLEGAVVPPSAQILLCPVPDPQRFGVAAVDADGHVTKLIEKPADPPSNLALCGVYLFTPAIHEAVRSIQPSERGELEITDAIQWLIDQGHRVRHDVLEGWWLDTGKKDPLLESNRRVLEVLEPRCDGKVDEDSTVDGRVVIEEGAELVASTVRGPAVIGARTRLVNSYVGPFTAIGDDCEVVGSEVEQSVVLDHSRIIGVPRLSDSLVGRHVEVLRTDRRPRATRLMVGDHCTIELD